MRNNHPLHPLALAALTACLAGHAGAQSTLTGFAVMPPTTFSDGPTSGQFAGKGDGGNALPLLNMQPVQGFSTILHGPIAGTYTVMMDNGFGAQNNSADTLLHMYALMPDWKTASGGTGTVSPVNFTTGAALIDFSAASRITLSDPDRKLGFTIQADLTHYYNSAINPAVAPSIIAGRLLTGADLDIESARRDKNGNIWFGDEFGPFLVKTDATGRVLSREVRLPGVQSPQSPYLAGATSTLETSRGFEGMAINMAGDRLYTLLEGTVAGDAARTLRINELNIDTGAFTSEQWIYPLEPQGTAIGEMTAISDTEFLVIERNGATATTTNGDTPFKKIFKVDLTQRDTDGRLIKTEIVDLMNIADPNDLNGDGNTVFTFPYVTIESVLILDNDTLLVVNDNNFPGTGGRLLGVSDPTEFLRIKTGPIKTGSGSEVSHGGKMTFIGGDLIATGCIVGDYSDGGMFVGGDLRAPGGYFRCIEPPQDMPKLFPHQVGGITHAPLYDLHDPAIDADWIKQRFRPDVLGKSLGGTASKPLISGSKGTFWYECERLVEHRERGMPVWLDQPAS